MSPRRKKLYATTSSSKPGNQVSKSYPRKEVLKYYSVEKILGRRINQGKVDYLLKWSGYPDSQHSWETADNVTKDLLVEFEEDYLTNKMISESTKELILLPDTPIKILDIRKTENGKLEYMVQWKTLSSLDWIPDDIPKTGYPHLVIQFYERITKIVDKPSDTNTSLSNPQ